MAAPISLHLGEDPASIIEQSIGEVVFEAPAATRDTAEQGGLGAETFIAWPSTVQMQA